MATYFVRPTNGSDGNDGLSYANAFQTTQKAVDTAASAGDIIRLVPEATETISAAIDFDTNSGASGNPIIIEPGDTTDGSRDVSLFYTISTASSVNLFQLGTTFQYYRIHNVILDGNASAPICMSNTADGPLYNVFVNCRFTDATGDNISIRGTSPYIFFNCEVDNAGSEGIVHATSNRAPIFWFGGSIHDNTSHGWNLNRTSSKADGVVIYANGGSGIFMGSASPDATITNCTFFNNSSDGLTLNASDIALMIKNNIFSDNGGYGINFNTTGGARWMDFNHTYNNTSGAADITIPGDNNVTGDPLFTNTTAGSEDLTLGAGSPCIDTGFGYDGP